METQYDSLPEALAALTDALTEYQRVVNRMFAVHSGRIDLCDRMVTELRDDTHESMTALSNRIESATRTPFACDPDESGGLRDDAA